MVERKTRKEEWWAWGLSGLLVTASLSVIWSVFLVSSFAERDRSLALQTERAQNAATAFGSNLGSLIGDSRLALTVLSRVVSFSPDQNPLNVPEFRNLVDVIRDQSQDGLDVRVVDSKGYLRILGPQFSKPAVYVGDRDSFLSQVPYPGGGFAIGRPVLDHLSGHWSLDLSVAAPPNRGGLSVLMVSLGFPRLDSMVASVASEDGEVVSIYRKDGALLYRYPLTQDFPEAGADSPYRALLNTRTPTGLLPVSGLATYQMVAKLQLWVVVSVPTAALLAPWEQQFWTQLLWVGLLTLVLLASTIGLLSFLRKLRDLRLAQEELARVDPLTGLLNRRAFLERCDQEQLRHSRHPGTLSLVLLDLDHFKSVNDRFGHQAGDKALRDFSEALAKTLRVTDVQARIGGEEFAVLMLATDGGKAAEIGDRVRAEVATIALPDGFLTTSLGVAEWDGVEPFEAWFARADRALYRAKEQGRNRVEVAV
jgi:diguanylate cyclase (GGDEF)-like protein